MQKEIELKTEIEHLMRFCKNNSEARDRLNKISNLIEQTKQDHKQAIKDVINKMGSYPCGFIDSSDNLCDKIDKDELIQKLEEIN